MKKKIVTSVICLAVILVFNFALPRLMPGDTVLMLVGMDEGVVSADEYAFYAEKTGAAQHPFFGKWVSDYSSEGYAQMNTALVALMDKLAEGADEKQIQHLTEIFVNCTRYELGFWDMAWEMRL